ncbi:MAG: efflux RND transporter periplasmic adaptor subunit [Planctomycetota bacterium]
MSKNVNQAFYVLFLCVFFAAIGIAGGWVVGSRKSGGSGGEEGGDAHGHSHGGHDHAAHAAAAPSGLSKQTILNLGVTMKDAETSDYVLYKTIPATVVDSPNATQPVVAPVSGVVRDVRVRPGTVATNGAIVVTLLREPFPRPVLKLTDEIIKPANEQIHSAVSDVRRALRGTQLLRTELTRVEAFTKASSEPTLLPRKTEIDLRYELARNEQDLANARDNLNLHGFTAEQIAEIETGKNISLYNRDIWQRALRKGGLWNDRSDAINALLHSTDGETAWTIAVLGELTGMGLATQELIDFLKSDSKAAAHFSDIAGLLQQGHTLTHIKSLHAVGAFNPVVEVTIPTFAGVADWDIQKVLVKPFDKVEAGAKLVVLSDARQMFLRAQPTGDEFQTLAAAYSTHQAIEAAPLIDGSGPSLKALNILYVGSDESGEHPHSAGAFGYIPVQNEASGSQDFKIAGATDSAKFRSWKLHEGTRYQLRVPVKTLKDVYVFPADAVADDGPEKVVYIQNGDSFKPAKVVILFQDHDVVVLDSKTSELFAGDTVVQRGAFGLSLALKSSGGAIDPHAGHNH